MRHMFSTFFAAFTALFGAFHRGANALDHLARWGEGESKYLADSAEAERASDIAELERRLASTTGKSSKAA